MLRSGTYVLLRTSRLHLPASLWLFFAEFEDSFGALFERAVDDVRAFCVWLPGPEILRPFAWPAPAPARTMPDEITAVVVLAVIDHPLVGTIDAGTAMYRHPGWRQDLAEVDTLARHYSIPDLTTSLTVITVLSRFWSGSGMSVTPLML